MVTRPIALSGEDEIYDEFEDLSVKHGIKRFLSKWVTRKYAFEQAGVPAESNYMKIRYGFDEPQLPSTSRAGPSAKLLVPTPRHSSCSLSSAASSALAGSRSRTPALQKDRHPSHGVRWRLPSRTPRTSRPSLIRIPLLLVRPLL